MLGDLGTAISGGSLGALFESSQWKWSIDRRNRDIYTNPGSVLAPREAWDKLRAER